MDFEPSDDQVAFANTLSRFATDRFDGIKREAYLQQPSGYDPAVWKELSAIGLIYLRQSEADGGLGGSTADLMMAMQSLGPALLTDPWLPALVASRLVSERGSEEQKKRWLPPLASGETTLGLALSEAGLAHPLMHTSTTARPVANGFVCNGSKQAVLAGASKTFLVAARDVENAATRLFILPADTPGLSIRQYRAVDGSLLCDLQLRECNVNKVALLGNEDAFQATEDALAEACIALVSEAVGIMDHAISKTVEHVKLRKQFGVPLSSFQVIQHRLADCATDLELVRGLMLRAALLADNPETPRNARLSAAFGAKAFASSAARKISEEAVQLHGAIGITEELWIGQAMKRLLMIGALFGDQRAHTAYCDSLRAGESL